MIYGNRIYPTGKEDLDFWKKYRNDNILRKIRSLIAAIKQSPYEGIGKPEALKYNLSGCWSRRINKEHRILYEVFDNRIIVLSMKGHY